MFVLFVLFLRNAGEEAGSGDHDSARYEHYVFDPDPENPHAPKLRENHISEVGS